jgi:hypothetical protein
LLFAFSEVTKVFFRVSGADIKTRVNRKSSWEDPRVGETFYHLGKHLLIESLGHGERFGTRVELGKL